MVAIFIASKMAAAIVHETAKRKQMYVRLALWLIMLFLTEVAFSTSTVQNGLHYRATSVYRNNLHTLTQSVTELLELV